ncbi:MAG: regulatory iron-sulfur-containing complex subunit RicT [Zavarzinella sp.]
MSVKAEQTGYIVRHGRMRRLGHFTPTNESTYERHDQVIIKTERGLEVGDLLTKATPQVVQQLEDPSVGEILRKLTTDDQRKLQEQQAKQSEYVETSKRLITEHRLAMQVVDIETTFGGERFVLYFLSEGRVDFRELVRSMARAFHTRIELRQIGVRDEAKLLADFGDCGKPVCCNTHLAVMPPVSMRMAKIQKSTLDPSKISGRCGRLKCCLRFEQDVYDEFLKELPNVGARIVTGKGQGRVIAQEILARRLLVEFEDGRRLPVAQSEILTVLSNPKNAHHDS